MESWDNLTAERRQSNILSGKRLISESEKAYTSESTEEKSPAGDTKVRR